MCPIGGQDSTSRFPGEQIGFFLFFFLSCCTLVERKIICIYIINVYRVGDVGACSEHTYVTAKPTFRDLLNITTVLRGGLTMSLSHVVLFEAFLLLPQESGAQGGAKKEETCSLLSVFVLPYFLLLFIKLAGCRRREEKAV